MQCSLPQLCLVLEQLADLIGRLKDTSTHIQAEVGRCLDLCAALRKHTAHLKVYVRRLDMAFGRALKDRTPSKTNVGEVVAATPEARVMLFCSVQF